MVIPRDTGTKGVVGTRVVGTRNHLGGTREPETMAPNTSLGHVMTLELLIGIGRRSLSAMTPGTRLIGQLMARVPHVGSTTHMTATMEGASIPWNVILHTRAS